MRMGEGLAILGLNNLSFINGTLNVMSFGSLQPVTSTPFLPALTTTFGLTVIDYGVRVGQPHLFNSLPFQSLKLTYALVLSSTGLLDMSSFSGLRCVGIVVLLNNTALASLSGLENLRYIDRSNFFVNGSLIIKESPLLDGPAKFRPLSLAGGCGGPPLPNLIDITVASCPTTITSFPQLCTFIAGSAACP
jgi:hypothetical protein